MQPQSDYSQPERIVEKWAIDWLEIDDIRDWVKMYRKSWLKFCKNPRTKAWYSKGGSYEVAEVYMGRYTRRVTFKHINLPDPILLALVKQMCKKYKEYKITLKGRHVTVYFSR